MMTVDDICKQYHLTRLAVVTRLATAKLVAHGGTYRRMDVERAFAPPEPPPMSDAEGDDLYYDHLREIGW